MSGTTYFGNSITFKDNINLKSNLNVSGLITAENDILSNVNSEIDSKGNAFLNGATTVCGSLIIKSNPTDGYVLTSNATGTATWASVTATNASNITGGTANELVYQTGVDATGFLDIGASGQILSTTATGGTLGWVNPIASDITGGTDNSMVYQTTASDTQFIANGTTNQVLTATTDNAPSWTNGNIGGTLAKGSDASGYALTNCSNITTMGISGATQNYTTNDLYAPNLWTLDTSSLPKTITGVLGSDVTETIGTFTFYTPYPTDGYIVLSIKWRYPTDASMDYSQLYTLQILLTKNDDTVLYTSPNSTTASIAYDNNWQFANSSACIPITFTIPTDGSNDGIVKVRVVWQATSTDTPSAAVAADMIVTNPDQGAVDYKLWRYDSQPPLSTQTTTGTYSGTIYGLIKTKHLICDSINTNNIQFNNTFSSGVVLYTSTIIPFPIPYTNPDMQIYLAVEETSGSATTSQNPMIAVQGIYVNLNLHNSDSFFSVAPGYGLIGWNFINFTGAVLINFKNETNQIVLIKSGTQYGVTSIKIFKDDIEILQPI